MILVKGKKYSVLIFLMSWVVIVNAQDVSFSQYYSNPMYLNPAFAGTIGVPRVALQYRNQWHGFSNAYNTYSAAIDLPIEKLRGGLGLNVLNDAQANGALNTFQLNLAYSVRIRLNEKYWLNGGLQTGYSQNSLKTDKLVFADNLDPNFGNNGISGELAYLTDPNYSYFDFSTGVLLYSSKLFAGLAAHHLNEPNQAFISGSDSEIKLHRKFTAHLGAKLPVYLYGHQRKKFDISPQLIVQKQGEFEQVNYGLFAAKRGIALGAWFRQNFGLRYDAVIFLFGFVRKQWQFTYSYDLTVSGLGGNSGGTSEVSLVFLLGEIKQGRPLPFFDKYEEKFGGK